MILSQHFQLLPSPSQVIQLEKLLSLGRIFWNYILDLDQNNFLINKKSLSKSDLEHLVKSYKLLSDDNNLLHTHLYQNIIKRYCDSRSNAFRKFKSKQSETLEFPKFKKDEFLNSLTFKEYNNGCNIKGNKVKFNHLFIKFNKHCEVIGKVNNIQIKRISSKKYKLIIVCEVSDDIIIEKYNENSLNQYKDNVYFLKDKNIINDNKIVGIDLGINKLVTCSNGKVFENPKHIKKYDKRLNELKEKIKGQVEGSNRQKKTIDLYRKKHEKVVNIRKDYLHKISKELVLTCETIIMEDLNIDSMKRSGIFNIVKKYISDASWHLLGLMISYKCIKYGKRLIKVNPAYTTQECCICGKRHKMGLGDRIYICEDCGLRIDRDLNSSIRVREKGIEQTFGIKSEKPIPSSAWCG